MKNKFSFFKAPITNTRPSESIDLRELYKRITGPDYIQETENLRKLEDPKQARQYKATHFSYVTFAGCFERRGDKHLLNPSGLIVIDLDDLPEVAPVREALLADTEFETALLFVSPSGRGLKWVTSYQYQEISHQNQFQLLCSYLEAVYGLKADPSGKDISRACFINTDNQAVLGRRYLI